MKTRNGFVSNSSSSSFIIAKRDLKSDQIEKIQHPPVDHGMDGSGKFTDYLTLLENEVALAGYAESGIHWINDWLINIVKVPKSKITFGD